jgi:hypothetical protein
MVCEAFLQQRRCYEQFFQGSDCWDNTEFLSSYGSWIIITSTKDDCQSLIHAGGDFLKLSLNSVNKKIAIHPMTQPLEEKGFADNIRRELGIKEKIQFILRAGYVEEYPLPVSERMPVERIVI